MGPRPRIIDVQAAGSGTEPAVLSLPPMANRPPTALLSAARPAEFSDSSTCMFSSAPVTSLAP